MGCVVLAGGVARRVNIIPPAHEDRKPANKQERPSASPTIFVQNRIQRGCGSESAEGAPSNANAYADQGPVGVFCVEVPQRRAKSESKKHQSCAELSVAGLRPYNRRHHGPTQRIELSPVRGLPLHLWSRGGIPTGSHLFCICNGIRPLRRDGTHAHVQCEKAREQEEADEKSMSGRSVEGMSKHGTSGSG
jgi:hypothetical protein